MEILGRAIIQDAEGITLCFNCALSKIISENMLGYATPRHIIIVKPSDVGEQLFCQQCNTRLA
jgi:hypothetical protein